MNERLIAEIRALPRQRGHDDDDPLINELTEAQVALVKTDAGMRFVLAKTAIVTYVGAMTRLIEAHAAVLRRDKEFKDSMTAWLRRCDWLTRQ